MFYFAEPSAISMENLRKDILKYSSELGLSPAGYRRIVGEDLKQPKKSKLERRWKALKSNLEVVNEYARSITKRKKVACPELRAACRRYFRDQKNKRYEFRTEAADFVIGIIEKTFVHEKGEAPDGSSLKGKPFLLQPWQKFIIYNLLGFYIAGTDERRFKEAFIYIPRKNGKNVIYCSACVGIISITKAKRLNGLYCRCCP